jgi:hypothetical protein
MDRGAAGRGDRAGRPAGITRSRRRWLVLGGALGAAGAAVAAVGAWRIDWAIILIGLVVVELGLVLCTPAIVGLVARLGRVLPLAPRIALRDAGLGAAEAVLFALNQREASVWPAPAPYTLAVPWLNVGIALVVVPLIAMLGAGLLTRSRLPIERRL